MSKNESGIRRFRAKVANHGFRGQYWQVGDIVEATPEEAEVIPHHFEELGKADDGSEDKDLQDKLIEQEKIDHLKDKKAKATYDVVRPVIEGGPAVAVEKKPEDKAQEAADRKAEERENDARREEARKSPRRRAATAAAPAEPNEPEPHGRKHK